MALIVPILLEAALCHLKMIAVLVPSEDVATRIVPTFSGGFDCSRIAQLS
jgi:hypothetical protein